MWDVVQHLEEPFQAARYHSLVIDQEGFPEEALEVTARTEDGTIMAVRHRDFPKLQVRLFGAVISCGSSSPGACPLFRGIYPISPAAFEDRIPLFAWCMPPRRKDCPFRSVCTVVSSVYASIRSVYGLCRFSSKAYYGCLLYRNLLQ